MLILQVLFSAVVISGGEGGQRLGFSNRPTTKLGLLGFDRCGGVRSGKRPSSGLSSKFPCNSCIELHHRPIASAAKPTSQNAFSKMQSLVLVKEYVSSLK